jgi:hypothetical protein
LKHAIGNVFNMAVFKECAQPVGILLDIFRDLGILGLVCLGLHEEQLFHELLRSWNAECAVQKIVLHHIEKQLETVMFEITV